MHDAAVVDGALADTGTDASIADAARGDTLDFTELDLGDAATPSGPLPTQVPAGWRCRHDFALDRICDCGCGALDATCQPLGCTEPGCSLPACDVCYDEDGATFPCGAAVRWLCDAANRDDGVCDCGCGEHDPDCAGEGCFVFGCSVAACARCLLPSGALGECPAPAAYDCAESVLSDGKCDCGCGNYDPDCSGPSCTEAGCFASGCEVCHGDKGKVVDCEPPEPTWGCSAAQRDDGVCDCGCGIDDPDCADEGCSAGDCQADGCQLCHDAAGRPIPCAGLYACEPKSFGDGVCDCGCAQADVDCDGMGCVEANCEDAACEVRHGSDGKALPPDSFSCDPALYAADDGCDCGCGAPDPDCTDGCTEADCRVAGCDRCRDAAGELFNCDWACELERFGANGVCDCGCGDFDPDCNQLGCADPSCYADACERCVDSSGDVLPCERGLCPATYFGDGVCDCGCRDGDPDCAGRADCVEPGCGTKGCGRCHDDTGAVVSCSGWTCTLEQQGTDGVCNCGCGAADPDCGPGGGCVEPGCIAGECMSCRTVDGAPMSCMP